ncbi:histidine kinase [Pseudomonas sp. MAP12]|uniref:Histidine kinase n=1 Tax=Geopseudomonas aromaticivorans TaxID=2849492 RepID=A0ABS6MY04_9GAMM|nr:histidine kinase [Pseudomonas aromaticivorans]
MNRPAPVKPDNFFVLLLNALRRRRVPIALRIVSHSLLLVSLVVLVCAWVLNMQLRQATQEQIEAVGQSLKQQTVASATELLVAKDLLSLNVMLDNLAQNPLVAHVVIHSVDNRIIAEAGVRPKQSTLDRSEGVFSAPIAFQEIAAGQLQLTLDLEAFRKPLTVSQQNLGLLGLIIAIVTLFSSLRLGSQLTTPLLQLRLWLRAPDDPAPANERLDEIGDLARQLQNRLVPVKPEPAEAELEAREEDDEVLFEGLDNLLDERRPARVNPAAAAAGARHAEPDFAADLAVDLDALDGAAAQPQRRSPTAPLDSDDFELDADELGLEIDDLESVAPRPTPATARPPATPRLPAVHTAVLAIQLGGQEELQRLPQQRLRELLQRYRDCLEQAARLYHGNLQRLDDGGSLILFHSNQSGEDYLTRALCCGELLRALGHALQIEIADRGLTLRLQLGLSQGEGLYGLSPSELLLRECSQSALQLNRHSRNLLLLDQSLSADLGVRARARIRAIASPANASCVERLLDPLPARLEQQLGQMLQQA